MSGKVVVYHGPYGCDTGCCGHWVEVGGRSSFVFDHATGGSEADMKAFAKQLITDEFGAEHCADLDWENCQIVADCNW